MVPLSAVILTFNEADNVETALRTVAGWCAEIHVVDSGSTDGTLDIVRKYTSRIYHHPYKNHSDQWAWVLANVRFGHEWLLLVDADFILTDRLKELVAETLRGNSDAVSGYF